MGEENNVSSPLSWALSEYDLIRIYKAIAVLKERVRSNKGMPNETENEPGAEKSNNSKDKMKLSLEGLKAVFQAD